MLFSLNNRPLNPPYSPLAELAALRRAGSCFRGFITLVSPRLSNLIWSNARDLTM
jgi:hypothetical protein